MSVKNLKKVWFTLPWLIERGERREALDLTCIGFTALVGLMLIWLVVSSSLPYVFARTAPDFALRLSPQHPGALLVKAERARARLLAMITSDIGGSSKQGGGERGEPGQNAPGLTLDSRSPAMPADKEKGDGDRAALRAEITTLATRILLNDPLNARAFRMLAELENDPERVRSMMIEAVKRSRRESAAVFWLLNDSFYRKDFQQALDHAETLYRTRRPLTKFVMSYLGQIAETPQGRALIVERLASRASWRSAFFNALPRVVRGTNTPLDLMMGLKRAGHPPTPTEMKPYLTSLMASSQVDLAYNVWLQLLAEKELSTLGFIYNPGFETDPSGLPFDWQIGQARNASLNFIQRADGKDGRVLHVKFGAGRITFPTLSQVLMLIPGRYQFSSEFRGKILAKRGLRWSVSCLQNKPEMLAETDMLKGVQKRWKTLVLEFIVANDPGCRAHVLRLFHDARSASEKFISGEAFFDGLDIKRIGN